jgi:ferredoxin hydrogenase large subunit
VVGGVTCYDSLNQETIDHFRSICHTSLEFVENAMMTDVLLLAKAHPESWNYGKTSNFMDFNDFVNPETGQDPYFKAGILWKNDFKSAAGLDMDEINEHVARSWYKGDTPRTPYEGETEPAYTSYEDKDKYSWSKAPRYKGEPMETGPLARRVIAYARNEKETRTILDGFMKQAGMKPNQLFSTMGRTVCRVVETLMLSRKIHAWVDEAENRIKSGDSTIYKSWQMPDEARGVGTCCVTRGGLSHWIRIKDKKIENFQLVVPSTWNLGPRCAEGKIGPVEESLLGCPCPDRDRPVEILRTVHSFDPCIACAVHVIDNTR